MLHPQIVSEWKDLIKNNYLVDLSSEPMLSNILDGPLNSTQVDGKTYGIPYDLVSLVTLYNKKIFSDNGLQVPTNYQEFLTLCETLKSKGITPISYGIKDYYVPQFLMWQIVPTTVYSKNTDWDNQLLAGQVKFSCPEWKTSLDMAMELINKGYTSQNALGIGDQQSVELFAKGDAAMICTGTWALGTARAANPNIDIGIFPFPANQPGEDLWMASDIGEMISIPSQSKNIDEAKKYVSAFTDPAYAQLWNDTAKSISTVKGVQNNSDPAYVDLTKYLSTLKTWPFANGPWPAGVGDEFCKQFQAMYADNKKVTEDDVLNAMDKLTQDKLQQQ